MRSPTPYTAAPDPLAPEPATVKRECRSCGHTWWGRDLGPVDPRECGDAYAATLCPVCQSVSDILHGARRA